MKIFSLICLFFTLGNLMNNNDNINRKNYILMKLKMKLVVF